MHAFYQPNLEAGESFLSKEESHHILKVLRLKTDDHITLLNGSGKTADASLIGKEGNLAKVRVETITTHPSIQPEIHLFFAPPKSNDRLDFILEKGTELGVTSFQLLMCRNSERKNVRLEKLQQKIIAASKQSLTPFFPKISDFISLNSAEINAENSLLFHCRKDVERMPIEKINLSKSINLFVGPEGDFNSEEIDDLIQKGAQSTSLGVQRLRTETACLSAIIKTQTLFNRI